MWPFGSSAAADAGKYVRIAAKDEEGAGVDVAAGGGGEEQTCVALAACTHVQHG